MEPAGTLVDTENPVDEDEEALDLSSTINSKGPFINLRSCFHMLNFVFITGVVSFILVTSKHRKPLKLSQKLARVKWSPHLGAGSRRKGAGSLRTGGQEGAALRGRKGAHLSES